MRLGISMNAAMARIELAVYIIPTRLELPRMLSRKEELIYAGNAPLRLKINASAYITERFRERVISSGMPRIIAKRRVQAKLEPAFLYFKS
jgi:hypothetical protein